MTLEVLIGDRVRQVRIAQQGALLHVTLDGRTHVIDARRIGAGGLSLLLQRDGDPRPVQSIDASIVARHGTGDLDVHVAGRAVPVHIREASSGRRGVSAGKAAGGPQRVAAPMPGKIVRVLVKAGDEVTARQGLVVVEAMKMENELRAARDGRVRDIAVIEGQSVEAGAVLMVVE